MTDDLHIERLWLANNLRNYNYIAVCKKTGEALIIDPFASDQILNTIKANQWHVKAVVNTHDHGDHIAGNDAIISATNAPLLAPRGARIGHVDRWLCEGDQISLGESIVFNVIDTSGHTLPHISLLSDTVQPELFCGDTIFNAGAGNVHSGDAETLFDTFDNKISVLDDNTRIYPGHDYMQTNLKFTLNIESDNKAAKDMLDRANRHNPDDQIITTIGQEKSFNTFLRLDQPSLVSRLVEQNPDLGPEPTRKAVFLKLRALRNQW